MIKYKKGASVMRLLFLCICSRHYKMVKAVFLPLNKTYELCTDPLF